MKNKGFTLTELLAVITILGLILMIILPKIKNSYEDAKKETYYNSLNNLVNTLNEYYARKNIQGNFNECTYDFTTNKTTCEDFDISGKKPSHGSITIDNNGFITGIVKLDKYYYQIENENIQIYTQKLQLGQQYVFDYTGDYQIFSVPEIGYYKIEAWGAQGGDSKSYEGGLGGYTSGNIYLNLNSNLYIYVGGKGTLQIGGYNGGGNAEGVFSEGSYPGGGGSTDIRYFLSKPSTSELAWNSDKGLKARIMVAGAGGGSYYYDSSWNSNAGDAGGLIGYAGEYYNTCESLGGSQTSAGTCSLTELSNGGFGYGGNGSNGLVAGGGSGYYGGAGRFDKPGSSSGGGGGSSYISGHTGCVAILENGNHPENCTTGSTNNSCSIHYSKMTFYNTVMIDGQGYKWTNIKGENTKMPSPINNTKITGKTGNGYVKITYLGPDI